MASSRACTPITRQLGQLLTKDMDNNLTILTKYAEISTCEDSMWFSLVNIQPLWVQSRNSKQTGYGFKLSRWLFTLDIIIL